LDLFDKTKIEKVYCYPQPYHVFGLLLGYCLSHINKFELVVSGGRYSASAHDEWLQTVNDHTLTLLTPTHLRDLATYLNRIKAKPVASYSCIIGGAKVGADDWAVAKDVLKITSPSI